jgi:hypothetical protein
MKLYQWKRVLSLILFGVAIYSGALGAEVPVRGINLTEQDGFVYDANPVGSSKSPAQIAVDQIKALGANHVILNPRAIMTDPKGSDVVPFTPIQERVKERSRYIRLMEYIHSLGMTVGIRPIFFVVRPDGTFPYIEIKPDERDPGRRRQGRGRSQKIEEAREWIMKHSLCLSEINATVATMLLGHLNMKQDGKSQVTAKVFTRRRQAVSATLAHAVALEILNKNPIHSSLFTWIS